MSARRQTAVGAACLVGAAAVLLGAACLVGCGTPAAATDARPAAGIWPANLDGNDASGGQCRGAGRAVGSCQVPNGASEICISNDPTRCPGLATSATCQNQCGTREYGIICGTVGPGANGNPPAGCRIALATPAGIAFYCCPCSV